MVRRLLALAIVLTVPLLFIVPAGQADVAGTLTLDDPLNDLMGNVQTNTTGHYRGLYSREPKKPSVNLFDIDSIGMTATGGKLTFTMVTDGGWPRPGALPTAADGFPAGTTTASVRWIWATDQNQAGGNSMTRRQTTNAQGACSSTHDNYEVARFDYDHSGTCNPATRGPFHPTDGWANAVGIEYRIGSGRIIAEWNQNLLDRTNPVFDIFWFSPGTDHDTGTCRWIFPASTDADKILRSACTTSFGYNAIPYEAAKLNGVNYSYSWTDLNNDNLRTANEVTEIRNGTFTPAWAAGGDRKTLTLEVPYAFRDDFATDHNGYQDETRAIPLTETGEKIKWVTAISTGEVSVTVPPDGPIRYGQAIHEAISSDPNDPIRQQLRDGVSTPAGSVNVSEEDEFSYGAGFLFTADWAPGNPFRAPGISPPAGSAYTDQICTGTTCDPDWGGLILAVTPQQPSYILNPLGMPFCRYPAGLVFGAGAVPSGVTTRVVDDQIDGGDLVILPEDASDPGGPGAASVHVNAAPGPRDLNSPSVGTGGDSPCGHTFNTLAGTFLSHGNQGQGNLIVG